MIRYLCLYTYQSTGSYTVHALRTTCLGVTGAKERYSFSEAEIYAVDVAFTAQRLYFAVFYAG